MKAAASSDAVNLGDIIGRLIGFKGLVTNGMRTHFASVGRRQARTKIEHGVRRLGHSRRKTRPPGTRILAETRRARGRAGRSEWKRTSRTRCRVRGCGSFAF